MRSRFGVLTLGLSCLLSSCSPRLAVGTPCTRSSECEGGLVCGVGGRCRVECLVSADCPLGAYCLPEPSTGVNGCSLMTDSCSAGTCEGGLRCIEGACLAVCLDDDECPDRMCSDGTCAVPERSDAGVPLDVPEVDAPRDDAPRTGCNNPPAAVTDFGVGLDGACAVLADGQVYCWGSGSFVPLTSGVATACEGFCFDRPVQIRDEVGPITGVVEVALGAFACARTAGGEVYCWGDGEGVNQVRVAGGVPLLASDIVMGRVHACAISSVAIGTDTTPGRLLCWGSNGEGQLGLGDVPSSDVARPVGTLVPGAIAASAWRTMMILGDDVVGFGQNEYAELGVAASVREIAPVARVGVMADAIGSGIENTCVLVDGEVFCWGREAPLLGTAAHRLDPCASDTCTTDLVPLSELSGIVGLSVDPYGTSAIAWNAAGAAYGWGSSYGEILNEGTQPTPDLLDALAEPVRRVAIGNHTACALTASDRLVCWGLNGSGELGRGYVSGSGEEPDDRFAEPPCW